MQEENDDNDIDLDYDEKSSSQFYDNSELPADVHLESGMASMSK